MKKDKDHAEVKQGRLKRLWEGWKKIARKIGDFNARVILTVFYIVILSPFAIMVKLLTDPLQIKKGPARGWLEIEKDELPEIEKAGRQF